MSFCYVNNLIKKNNNEIFDNNRSNNFDNTAKCSSLDTEISQSREELAKLVKEMKILEDKVNLQENNKLSNNIYTNKSQLLERSSYQRGNLYYIKKTIYRLLNDVQIQENLIKNSIKDIKQTIDYFELSNNLQNEKIQQIPGPSLRSNFNTASLPYRWWNRSMPCLPLLEHHKYISGSQDSLAESFQVRYFTPKKKKKSKISNNQNSGYCVWLPYNKTGEVYCFGSVKQFVITISY